VSLEYVCARVCVCVCVCTSEVPLLLHQSLMLVVCCGIDPQQFCSHSVSCVFETDFKTVICSADLIFYFVTAFYFEEEEESCSRG